MLIHKYIYMVELHKIYKFEIGNYIEFVYPLERLKTGALLGFKFNNTDERFGVFTSINNYDNIRNLSVSSQEETEKIYRYIISYIVFIDEIRAIYSIYS